MQLIPVPPLKKSIFINDVKLEIKVDAGAMAAVIPKWFQEQLKICKLNSTRTKLCICSEYALNVWGVVNVDVKCNHKA